MRARVLWRIAITTLREYLRSPEAIFWTYGFPFLMVVALGLAFGESETQPIHVGVVESESDRSLVEALQGEATLRAQVVPREQALALRKANKVAAVVSGSREKPIVEGDPANTDARQARLLVERACSGERMVRSEFCPVKKVGERYVDWLVPGLIGLNLLGAGLWGIGFNIVNMRTGQLLRRLVVAPMRRIEFLVAFLLSRMALMIPESIGVALIGIVLFGMPVAGSWLAILAVVLVGGIAFNGLGLLIAARPKTIEGVGGWMNLLLLPMWLLGGSFFENSKFPDWMQPAIQALPLTQVNDALRLVMHEGASLADGRVLAELGGLAAWGVVTMAVAVRIFRWV